MTMKKSIRSEYVKGDGFNPLTVEQTHEGLWVVVDKNMGPHSSDEGEVYVSSSGRLHWIYAHQFYRTRKAAQKAADALFAPDAQKAKLEADAKKRWQSSGKRNLMAKKTRYVAYTYSPKGDMQMGSDSSFTSAESAIKAIVEDSDIYFESPGESVRVFVKDGDEEKAAKEFAAALQQKLGSAYSVEAGKSDGDWCVNIEKKGV